MTLVSKFVILLMFFPVCVTAGSGGDPRSVNTAGIASEDSSVVAAARKKQIDIMALLRQSIKKELAFSKWNKGSKSLDFEFYNIPKKLDVPRGDFNIKCELPPYINGLRNVSFTINQGDWSSRRYSIGCRFHLDIKCPVATGKIKKGKRIDVGDIDWVDKDLAECYRQPATLDTDIYRLRARRFIRAGEMIPLDALESIPEVKRGERVVIEVKRGALKISAVGKSLEDGWIGDRVMIRNKTNGKIQKYCVISVGKVSTEFSDGRGSK
ncbi:flagellar basal body P-ring formation protein FlgA [bacterium]|nr:flagellar basal body P-ring formation protein FlgA [bacterium]